MQALATHVAPCSYRLRFELAVNPAPAAALAAEDMPLELPQTYAALEALAAILEAIEDLPDDTEVVAGVASLEDTEEFQTQVLRAIAEVRHEQAIARNALAEQSELARWTYANTDVLFQHLAREELKPDAVRLLERHGPRATGRIRWCPAAGPSGLDRPQVLPPG
jgi:hypothetical protein